MTNAERGRRTGQHEQPSQQAVMFRGCEQAIADIERERPLGVTFTLDERVIAASGFVRDLPGVEHMLDVYFRYADRIEINRYTNVAPWQDAAADALARQAAQDAADDAPANHCDLCGQPKAALVCDCETDTGKEREGIRRSDEDQEAR